MKTRVMAFFSVSLVLSIASLVSPPASALELRFRRSDTNGDSSLDLSDVIFTLRGLFLSGEEAPCKDAADSNDDGSLDISDPLYSLIHLFIGGPAPPAPGVECGSDPTADSLDCSAYPACPILGQSEFETRGAGPPSGPLDRFAQEDGGVPGAPAPPSDKAGPQAPERLIEESDIYRLSGNHLFVLNRYRGLQVIDLSDLDRPELVGQAPIFGYPREMYVRDERAYIIVSDYYTFWRDEVAVDRAAPVSYMRGFHGSQVRIIDISDPRQPQVVGGIDIEGDVSDTRIVGDVMYLASQRYPWYHDFTTDDQEDKTEILSVTIGDPTDIRVVERQSFPRNGWEHHLSVTPRTIYLASSGYLGGPRNAYETRIRAIDISDPAGAIQVRGEAVSPGRVQDRWSMDEYQGVLRVASGQFWGNGDVYLTTYSVENLDRISKLGEYILHVNERLTSARFDGPRGYLVTYRNIDPLFTFDLSNPRKPALLGELEMTGWLDFMVPMGERIVALGHEDLVRPDGGRDISLAVSLIDVSQQAKPKLLSRVALDGAWGWVPGSRDDFAKVFKTLPELELILFPFQAWSRTDYRYIGGVQLIDLKADKLTRRGLIENAGFVERGIPHQKTNVLTLSSEVFQVMDIADRDRPKLRGRLELARNVQEFAPLPSLEATGPYAVQLSGDWYRGDTQVTVTPLDDPNTAHPTAQVHVPAPYGRMFVNGAMAYIASLQEATTADGKTGQATRIQVVDLTDPASPRLRGSVWLPETVGLGYRYWYWGYGDEVVQVNGSTLAFHRYSYGFRCFDCGVVAGRPGPIEEPPSHKIYLVDLKDPDRPTLASTLTLSEVSWAWGLKASGSMLYLSTYRTSQDAATSWVTRYYLLRIRVADPARPVVLPEVNIPGMFVDASQDGEYIYTQESWWDSTTQKNHSFFYALALLGDKAHLQSKVELPGYPSSIQVKGSTAVATAYWSGLEVIGDKNQWRNLTFLLTIDLRNPQGIRLAGQTEIPFDYAYLQKVDGGRAFLGSWLGIFVYQVADVANPTFEKFFRTQGWSQDIVTVGDRAFVPSGYYGVQVLDLGPSVAP